MILELGISRPPVCGQNIEVLENNSILVNFVESLGNVFDPEAHQP